MYWRRRPRYFGPSAPLNLWLRMIVPAGLSFSRFVRRAGGNRRADCELGGKTGRSCDQLRNPAWQILVHNRWKRTGHADAVEDSTALLNDRNTQRRQPFIDFTDAHRISCFTDRCVFAVDPVWINPGVVGEARQWLCNCPCDDCLWLESQNDHGGYASSGPSARADPGYGLSIVGRTSQTRDRPQRHAARRGDTGGVWRGCLLPH